jgi:hypothetical protein
MSRMNRKQEYWDHFMSNKQYWGHGFTEKRLNRIKDKVFMDAPFWADILMRHGGEHLSPNQMEEDSKFNYDHCMGNMTGMLMQTFIEQKIIRP